MFHAAGCRGQEMPPACIRGLVVIRGEGRRRGLVKNRANDRRARCKPRENTRHVVAHRARSASAAAARIFALASAIGGDGRALTSAGRVFGGVFSRAQTPRKLGAFGLNLRYSLEHPPYSGDGGGRAGTDSRRLIGQLLGLPTVLSRDTGNTPAPCHLHRPFCMPSACAARCILYRAVQLHKIARMDIDGYANPARDKHNQNAFPIAQFHSYPLSVVLPPACA